MHLCEAPFGEPFLLDGTSVLDIQVLDEIQPLQFADNFELDVAIISLAQIGCFECFGFQRHWCPTRQILLWLFCGAMNREFTHFVDVANSFRVNTRSDGLLTKLLYLCPPSTWHWFQLLCAWKMGHLKDLKMCSTSPSCLNKPQILIAIIFETKKSDAIMFTPYILQAVEIPRIFAGQTLNFKSNKNHLTSHQRHLGCATKTLLKSLSSSWAV